GGAGMEGASRDHRLALSRAPGADRDRVEGRAPPADRADRTALLSALPRARPLRAQDRNDSLHRRGRRRELRHERESHADRIRAASGAGATVLALGNPTYRHERPALRQLDYAEKEIGTIKVLFGSRAVALSGDQATLASLQTHLASGVQSGSSPAAPGGPAPRAEGFGILHLATHGIV